MQNIIQPRLQFLALGDSYTIGEQVAYEDNFPNQCAQMLRQKAISIADPKIIAQTGWTTDELLAALPEDLSQENYEIVSLLIGVNNQYRGRSVENYAQEFQQLLNIALACTKQTPSNLWVLSIPDWGGTPFAADKDAQQISQEIDAFNLCAQNICHQAQVAFLDITSSTRKHAKLAEYLAPDGLHPSALEYTIWAKQLSDSIEKNT